MKRIIAGLIILVLIATAGVAWCISGAERRIDSLQEQLEQLQAERVDIDSLKAEMEDVKAVQGYVAWEQHWENRMAVEGEVK